MIRCDHPGCRAPTSYKDGKPHTFGTEPDWAQFVVGGLCYCGWCADLYDHDQTKRRHVLSIATAEEWKGHEARQARGSDGIRP